MARLELHKAGQHEVALARANPGSASALAINLVGSLRRYSGSATWNGMASDDHGAASALELHHHRLALDAFSVMAAIAHAACGRLAQAQVELFRINSVAGTNHADPAVHSDGADLVAVGTNAKTRKREAVYKADVVTQDFEAMMDHEIMPIQAAKLLGRDVAVDEVRERAKPFPESYPYSARAQLLRVFELEHVRALDLPADRKRHLRRILALVSGAAVVFDRSAADERCENSEVRVANRNSRTMVDQSFSDLPTDIDESVMNIATRIAEVEVDTKGISGQPVKEIASTSSDLPTDIDESVMNIAARIAEVQVDTKGISGQPVKEIASTSSFQQNHKVLNKKNADKDLLAASCEHSLRHLSAFTALHARNSGHIEPSDRSDGVPPSRRDRHGGSFGIAVPNIADTLFAGDIEEMGWVNMNELLGPEVEWDPLTLSGGRHELEPCLLVDNHFSSRKSLFFPYDDYFSVPGSIVETRSIIAVWGPLLLIKRDNGIFLLNIQTLHLRKIWEPILEISNITAGCIDFGRIVLAGLHNSSSDNMEDNMELWISERTMGEGDYDWGAVRMEHGDRVVSFLAIHNQMYWISGNDELVNLRHGDGSAVMNVYDLGEDFTARPQDMSLVWCGEDLMIIEVKQFVSTPVTLWKVTWDMEDNVSYTRCFSLQGFNAFVVPGYSGFILPADEDEVGDKVYVGDGPETDCYMYSLSESAKLDVMLCLNLPAHWSCRGRWLALRGDVSIDEDVNMVGLAH